jgi:hypothetical protein
VKVVFNFVEIHGNKIASSLKIKALAGILHWLLRGLPQSASKQMLRRRKLRLNFKVP